MVSAPSITEPVESTLQISLARTGDARNGAWLAEVDGLPQCSARGVTPEEAARKAWAVFEELQGSSPDRGTSGPPPTPKHSGKLLVRMPATLHDELAGVAENEGVSLNQLITGILASSVDWRSDGSVPGRRGASDATVDDPTSARGSLGLTRTVLLANFALVFVAGIVAIALLLTAWLG